MPPDSLDSPREKKELAAIYTLESCLSVLRERGVSLPKELIARLGEMPKSGHDTHCFEMFQSAKKFAEQENNSPYWPEEWSKPGETKILPENWDTILLVATLVHDIGKTGPLALNREEQTQLRKIFERRIDRDKLNLPTNQVLNEQEMQILHHPAINFDVNQSIITLLRRHAVWTEEILKSDIIPDDYPDKETIMKVASAHHFTEGENATEFNLLAAKRKDSTALLTKFLVALDKLNAAFRRSGEGKNITGAADRVPKIIEANIHLHVKDATNKKIDIFMEDMDKILYILLASEKERLGAEA